MITFGSNTPSGTIQCFSIDIMDDGVLEGDEIFNVALTNFDGANPGPITETQCIINDGNGTVPLVCFFKTLLHM